LLGLKGWRCGKRSGEVAMACAWCWIIGCRAMAGLCCVLDNSREFPVTLNKFPVRLKKFPVARQRELLFN
jgi:hypothetical protein